MLMRGTVALLVSACLPLLADTPLGQKFSPDNSMTVDALMARAAEFAGKVVQVKGKVTEVCERMGCWMNLVDTQSGKRVRVKVADGEIVFPKTSIGKMAVAHGTLRKLELTRQQAVAAARHEAEEQGRKFDPASVKSGATIYQIEGDGAVILD